MLFHCNWASLERKCIIKLINVDFDLMYFLNYCVTPKLFACSRNYTFIISGFIVIKFFLCFKIFYSLI